MAVTISPAAMGLGGRREFRGRATMRIDRADMAPDGLGNVCGMSQRAHMTGAGNLVIAGMGQSLAEDLNHPPRRPASTPAADEQCRSLDSTDRIEIIGRKHEQPFGGDLDR